MNDTSPDSDRVEPDADGGEADADGGEADASPGTDGRRRRVRRGTIYGGLVVALAAGLLAGYIAWQDYGSDVVSKHRQTTLADTLYARWQYPTVADLRGPGTTATLGQAEGLIRIPRLGPDYEVPLIEGVRPEDLSQGIGHFPGAGPGQVGNFAVVGHRSTHGEPFRDLAQLRPGDKVVVETSAVTYTYVLDTSPKDLTVLFDQTWVTDPVPVPPPGKAPPGMPTTRSSASTGSVVTPTRALITLTTSSELFHKDNRLVAFGHLVRTERKTP
ncbi:MAG: sortase domain-containing protein [Nocardioidaceae bacterium]